MGTAWEGTGDLVPAFDVPVTRTFMDVRGVVTVVQDGGDMYIIEDAAGGAYSGIKVYLEDIAQRKLLSAGGSLPKLGDLVEVIGTVHEHYDLTQITAVVNTTVLAQGLPLPGNWSTNVRKANAFWHNHEHDRITRQIEEPMNVTTGMFNHSAGCTAAAEMYEGVLTRFSGVKIESLRDEHGQ
eukprot:gene21641-26029_t